MIFLCTFDPFAKDEKVYRFSTMCEDVQGLPLGDRRYIMFLNSRGSKGVSNLDMDELFRYLNGGVGAIGMETKSGLVAVLDKYVQKYNRDDDWRKEYMKLELLLKDKYDEGEAMGETNERKRMVKAMHADGVSVDKISQYAAIPVEEVKAILKT